LDHDKRHHLNQFCSCGFEQVSDPNHSQREEKQTFINIEIRRQLSHHKSNFLADLLCASEAQRRETPPYLIAGLYMYERLIADFSIQAWHFHIHDQS
jgi:hypothetical protein